MRSASRFSAKEISTPTDDRIHPACPGSGGGARIRKSLSLGLPAAAGLRHTPPKSSRTGCRDSTSCGRTNSRHGDEMCRLRCTSIARAAPCWMGKATRRDTTTGDRASAAASACAPRIVRVHQVGIFSQCADPAAPRSPRSRAAANNGEFARASQRRLPRPRPPSLPSAAVPAIGRRASRGPHRSAGCASAHVSRLGVFQKSVQAPPCRRSSVLPGRPEIRAAENTFA